MVDFERAVFTKVHETDPDAKLLPLNLEEAGKDKSFVKDTLSKLHRTVIIKFDLTSLGVERNGLGDVNTSSGFYRIRNFYSRVYDLFINISSSCGIFYYGEEDELNLTIILDEALRNAFAHGNRLNFNVPIYLYIDPRQATVIVFDGNLKGQAEDKEYENERKASYGFLHGAGVGLEKSERYGMISRKKEGNAVVMVLKKWIFKDSVKSAEDQAMRGPEGGIDLTTVKRSLQTKDEGIKFHFDPGTLQQLQRAAGFVPVIIDIEPLADLRMFLGA